MCLTRYVDDRLVDVVQTFNGGQTVLKTLCFLAALLSCFLTPLARCIRSSPGWRYNRCNAIDVIEVCEWFTFTVTWFRSVGSAARLARSPVIGDWWIGAGNRYAYARGAFFPLHSAYPPAWMPQTQEATRTGYCRDLGELLV